MTEHKFGTWYPIEELDRNYRDVLFFSLGGGIDLGYRIKRRSQPNPEFFIHDGTDEIIPAFWMPLPPPPGEENGK